MSTSTVEYRFIEDVETLERYGPGGYHPIHINDRLHHRYRIVHKLGHGSYSTVWLGLDERTYKYVAIKVGITDTDIHEADILSQLTRGFPTDSDSADRASLILKVIDRFDLDGPNGIHPCFVMAPAWCDLRDVKESSRSLLFHLNVARSLAAQLAIAVAHVHSQGFVHGGS